MRVVVQRSKYSSVTVDGKIVGQIDNGLVLLVGITKEDTLEDLEYMAKKVLNLRIFDDNNGVMNKSILDNGGSILSISQFTLCANTKKGNRPSYIDAMEPVLAKKYYLMFNEMLRKNIFVAEGIFQADMLVNINNDGPITIILESKNK
ncbi:MAG: D-aminoacyl-tRNA deacylase [Bacilli bacterium]